MVPTPETVKKEFADFVAGLGPNHPVGWATEEAIYRQIAAKYGVKPDLVKTLMYHAVN